MSPAVQTPEYGGDIRVAALRCTMEVGAKYALLVCSFILATRREPFSEIQRTSRSSIVGCQQQRQRRDEQDRGVHSEMISKIAGRRESGFIIRVAFLLCDAEATQVGGIRSDG
jgi:hypothetical protein